MHTRSAKSKLIVICCIAHINKCNVAANARPSIPFSRRNIVGARGPCHWDMSCVRHKCNSSCSDDACNPLVVEVRGGVDQIMVGSYFGMGG